MLALDGALVRGALAFILSEHDDIDVVGEVGVVQALPQQIRSRRPDVVVADASTFEIIKGRLSCPALVLASARQARAVATAVRNQDHPCGLLGEQVAPQRVVDGVRRLARGEPVVDATLVVAALHQPSPLTEREVEVLQVAATGHPAKEIAARLSLSPGTVRNYLARVVTKVGARTRVEAVRKAREAGWIL
ncbi:DNA-binding response regulator [Phytohabitans rumicis]|uniref:DNA-binding response regulator n=1 Tax=Phytohabitans rumicis TaxID=1076125 RepID=A0A6V8LM51_9ACTN|nr:DNA-binding response regulator [Phytohabitans rumicis]